MEQVESQFREFVNLDINEAMLFFYGNGDFRYEGVRVTFSIFGVRVRLMYDELRKDLKVVDWRLCWKLGMMSWREKLISE